MSNENIASNNVTDSIAPLPAQGRNRSALVKKIGKTTYRVTIDFMLCSEVSQM
jgi:hypothetical protein